MGHGKTISIFLTLLQLTPTAWAQRDPFAGTAEGRDHLARYSHARELLGAHFSDSSVRIVERLDDSQELKGFIASRLHEGLPKKWKSKAQTLAQTLCNDSKRYALDPLFVLAMIENESRFNPIIVGSIGEIGLMQIRPTTATWIAKKFKIPHAGEHALYNPAHNIRLGTAFLSHLRTQFDSHSRLYLSAYNMGASSVRRLVESETWPRLYVNRVMKFYVGYYKDLEQNLMLNASSRASQAVETASRLAASVARLAFRQPLASATTP